MALDSLHDFLTPVDFNEITGDETYNSKHIGFHIKRCNELLNAENADLFIVGVPEFRGGYPAAKGMSGLEDIRKEFYGLFYWHSEINIFDLGNIKKGATIADTYAALKTVVKEIISANKRVLILGGSHDLTIAQYQAYAELQKVVELTVVDALIDFDMESPIPERNFLMQLFTSEPNFINHYNHLAFQSYFVHPSMLETIDKLRFDCYRTGVVKEQIEEMEPVVRNADLISFDISAIQHAHAPANTLSPNGLTGEEACTLMQFAGMSNKATTIGIYGYNASNDLHQLTAKQISHMMWYVLDGIYKLKQEAEISDADHFNQFKMAFSEVEATFLQSKRTGRWWMLMPDGAYISCSKNDYLMACQNEIPERWMRAMERS